MKKAKEYAADFNAGPTVENLQIIASAFFAEIAELAEQRGTGSDAMLGILNEQERKWKAFARRTDVSEDGFNLLFKKLHFDAWVLWKGSRQDKERLAMRIYLSNKLNET